MKFLIIFVSLLFATSSISKEVKNEIIISKIVISKKNEPGCKRQGNVWGYCNWMLKFQLKNSSNKDLKYFCSVFKLQNKKYRLCYGKNKQRPLLKENSKKTILINLKKHMNYNNDEERPKINFLKIKPYY